MRTVRFFERLDKHQSVINVIGAPLLLFLVAGVYVLVYATGGAMYVFSHAMYIPIVIAGFLLGIRGGILMAVLGGFAMGPFMPINVATGEHQQMANWLYRMGFFVLMGALIGAASDGGRKYQNYLKWLFEHNVLTKLQNRNALFERLSKLAKKQNTTDSFFLVVVSFENALELRSAFGFAVIEEATKQLAMRFELAVKKFENDQISKSIYHTDAAQLTVFLNVGTQDIDNILHELTAVAREHILYKKLLIHIDTRMGYVAFDSVDEDPSVYLQRAEAALTVAIEKAQDSMAYSSAIKTATEDNLSLLGELKEAIMSKELSLYYQPKVDIATGHIHGAEALMRWNHPTRGSIPPSIFIPRAEQSTLIDLITEFALKQAIKQMAEWQQMGIHLTIAVNVSARNLLQPGFTDYILTTLKHYGVSVQWLELEVTEGALMVDMEHTINELNRLSDLKITLSIDDFGTGYSSLQYLHKLPISLIKIDQSFVMRLPEDKGATYIVDAAVMLAHNMGIRTIAEGVETKEIYEYLSQIGCDMAQGYLISRPIPAIDFLKWYKQSNGKYTHAV